RVDEIDLENLSPAEPATDVPSHVIDFANSLGPSAARVVTVNGGIANYDTSSESHVTVSRASDFDVEQTLETDIDAFVRLNAAFSSQPIFVDVAAGAVVNDPVVIVHWIDGEDVAVFPRVVFRVGEAAQVTFVEYFASSESRALVPAVTEIVVDQAAH